MQQVQNDISKIKLQFGPDFNSEGKTFVKANLRINKQQANEQLQFLQQQTNNHLEVPWSLILVLNVDQSNKFKVLNLLQDAMTKSVPTSELQSVLYDSIQKNKLKMKYFDKNDKIYVSFQFDLKPIIEVYNNIVQSGYQEILNQFQNSVSLSVSTNNTFQDAINAIEGGERAGSFIFNNFKVDMQISLSKDIFNVVQDLLMNLVPEIVHTPPMVLLKSFTNLEMDLKFASSEEFPDLIKKQVLAGKSLCTLTAEQKKLKESMDSALNVLLETIDTDVELYFTIPDGAALEVKGRAPSLSQFIKTFGGFLLN